MLSGRVYLAYMGRMQHSFLLDVTANTKKLQDFVYLFRYVSPTTTRRDHPWERVLADKLDRGVLSLVEEGMARRLQYMEKANPVQQPKHLISIANTGCMQNDRGILS